MGRETMEVDPAAKKAVLRMVSYGLYAVGVRRGEERNMFTANWFTQVSFDPTLVVLSVETSGHSIEMIRDTGVFALTVFDSGDRETAGRLGKRWSARPDKIEGVDIRDGVTGCPILSTGLGAVECRVVGSMAAGDSTLLLAEVVHAEVLREGEPLTMAAAGFRHAG